jgi:GNAT superfamily N-acetyltransferase
MRVSSKHLNAVFRELEVDDFDNVVVLYRELTGTLPVADGPEGRAHFQKILQTSGNTVFGAEVEAKIVSVASLHILPNMTFSGRPYCLVENVVTLKSHRGQGLGRGVMELAIKAAWAADACRIVLLTGKTLNAHGFYQKLGFTADRKFGMILEPDANQKL